MGSKTYADRRNFSRTPEPPGGRPKEGRRRPVFVVQKHDSSSPHYDFRKRLDGLKRKTSPFAGPEPASDAVWVSPTLVGEFGFTEWTSSGKLRHPRFLGLRRDKKPDQVVRERPERSA